MIGKRNYRFTRRELREHAGWGQTQVGVHLARLVQFEYILTHRRVAGGAQQYELAYDWSHDGTARQLLGLSDPREAQAVGGCRGDIGPVSGGCRGVTKRANQDESSSIRGSGDRSPELARSRDSATYVGVGTRGTG
jgi:hypothetical protein